MKPEVSRRKGIIKIRGKIKTKKTLGKINETELILWKDKQNRWTLGRLTQKKRRAHIKKIRNKKGEVTNYTTEIKDYNKQLDINKLNKLGAMDKFRETQSSKIESWIKTKSEDTGY